MRSALFAVAVTALAAGLVVAPAAQQSAVAGVHSGLKSGAPASVAGDLILVGKGGRGGGRGFKGGGRGGFKSAHRGGGFKGYRGGGKNVYRGGGKRYAYKGRNYNNWNRYHGKNYYKGKRYAYRGRYRGRYWYGPNVYVGAGYGGGCAWLRRQALVTGSSYWWSRYNACVGYY
jgi:hypothetical protein